MGILKEIFLKHRFSLLDLFLLLMITWIYPLIKPKYLIILIGGIFIIYYNLINKKWKYKRYKYIKIEEKS